MEAKKRSIIRHLQLHPDRCSLTEIQGGLNIDKFELLCCLHELNKEGVIHESKNLTLLGLNMPNGAKFSLIPDYRSKR